MIELFLLIILNINKQMNYIIKDLIAYKLKYRLIKNNSLLYSKTKTKVNSLLVKIKFINKGIEFIKLESILSNPNIINTLPNFCTFNKPTIIYKYLL